MAPSAIRLALWSSMLFSVCEGSMQLIQRDVPSVVRASMNRVRATSSDVSKRDINSTVGGPAFFFSTGSFYATNVSIGTPPQHLAMALDPSSHELQVMEPYSTMTHCSNYPYCVQFGQYDPSKSSSCMSWDNNTQGGMYVPTCGADFFRIGSQNLGNTSFIALEPGPVETSSMGISEWPTSMPFQLVDRGLTNSPSFSLWVEPGNSTGEILFGGVNTAKYQGPLQAYPQVSGSWAVPLNGITVQEGGGGSSTQSPSSSYNMNLSTISLDITSSYTYLPNNTLQKLYADLNITLLSGGNFPGLNCSRKSEQREVSVIIGNRTFTAPWSELVLPYDTLGHCEFAIAPYIPSNRNLGQGVQGQIGVPFLEAMYIVVDYDNMYTAVAPLESAPGPDNIMEIGNGTKIPDATGTFPATITAYTPSPTAEASPSTTTDSDSLASALTVEGKLHATVAGIVALFMVFVV